MNIQVIREGDRVEVLGHKKNVTGFGITQVKKCPGGWRGVIRSVDGRWVTVDRDGMFPDAGYVLDVDDIMLEKAY